VVPLIRTTISKVLALQKGNWDKGFSVGLSFILLFPTSTPGSLEAEAISVNRAITVCDFEII
jgi:hypothetical protein